VSALRIVEDVTSPHDDYRFGVEVERLIYPKLFPEWILEHGNLTKEAAHAIVANKGSNWKVV